jgi:hypothetical protein
MTKSCRNFRMLTILAALLASACKTTDAPGAPGGGAYAGDGETPAVLASEDDIPALKAALAGALGRARIELGAGDPTREPVVAVLPPPLGPNEDRSPATPALFDLVLRNGGCYAVSRETGEETALAGVECVSIDS